MPAKGYSFATWLRIEEAPRAPPTDGRTLNAVAGTLERAPPPTNVGAPSATAALDRALYTLLSRGEGPARGMSAAFRGPLSGCCEVLAISLQRSGVPMFSQTWWWLKRR